MSEVNLLCPSNWTIHSIEKLFAPLDDGRTLHQGWSPQCEKEPSSSEKTWGVLKTTSIQPGEFQAGHNKLLPSNQSPRPGIEVKEGDLLITCAGPRVRCGVACLVKKTRKRLMISGKMYRFRVNPERINPHYLEAFLQTDQARNAIDKMKTGISDSGLNLTHSRFRQLPVPVAPLLEQNRIVAEIEQQFTRLEAGVTALRQVQAKLKRYRAAVLKAACEGRLVPTEAELARQEGRSYEPASEVLARILAERRKNWQGRGKYKQFLISGDLVPLSEGWTWTTVEDLISADRVSAYGVLQPGDDVPGGIPFVRVGDINNGKIDTENLKHISLEIAAQYPRTRLYGGELAITLVGAIGRTAIIPASLAGGNTARAVGILPLTKVVDAHWVEIWFRNPKKLAEMTSKSHEVARKTLNLEDVRAAKVALPPLAEQKRIVAEVERRLSVVDELEATVTDSEKRATRLRQSLLQKAFTGGLS